MMEQIIKFKLVTHFYYGIYNSKPKLLNALSPNIAAKWSILPFFRDKNGQKWQISAGYTFWGFFSIQLRLLQGEVSITISNWIQPKNCRYVVNFAGICRRNYGLNEKFPLVALVLVIFNSIVLNEVSISISHWIKLCFTKIAAMLSILPLFVEEIMARWHFSVRENPTFISITRISYFLNNNKICGCNKITTFICLIAWSVHKL